MVYCLRILLELRSVRRSVDIVVVSESGNEDIDDGDDENECDHHVICCTCLVVVVFFIVFLTLSALYAANQIQCQAKHELLKYRFN